METSNKTNLCSSCANAFNIRCGWLVKHCCKTRKGKGLRPFRTQKCKQYKVK